MNEEISLSKKFQDAIDLYPQDKLKYIHWKSVRNFLYHLADFPDTARKMKVVDLLSDYIDLIDLNHVVENSQESSQLFKEYIEPIGKLYEQALGFQIFLKTSTILFFSFLTFILLYISKSNYYFSIALLVIDIILITRNFYLDKKHKCYSVFY